MRPWHGVLCAVVRRACNRKPSRPGEDGVEDDSRAVSEPQGTQWQRIDFAIARGVRVASRARSRNLGAGRERRSQVAGSMV